MDLIYVQTPGYPSVLTAFDWTGRPRGTVRVQCGSGPPASVTPAPRGNGFLAPECTLDRLGRVVASASGGKGYGEAWSQDGTLLCGVDAVTHITDETTDAGTTDYYLTRRAPGGQPVRVGRFLHLDGIPGDMGFNPLTCSPQTGTATLLQTVCCSVASILRLRLSDATLVAQWHRDDATGEPKVSRDGNLLAIPRGKAPDSTEVRTLDGTVLRTFGAGVSVLTFSGDDRFALLESGYPDGPFTYRYVNLASGRTVWSQTTPRPPNGAFGRPGGADLALALTDDPFKVPCPTDPTNSCPNATSLVTIIHGDGSTASLGGPFDTPWPGLWP